MRNAYRLLLWIILLFFLFIQNVIALDFRIDRPKVRIKMPPGWSDGGIIKVDNRANEPIKIRVYSGDWIYSGQDGSKNFMPPATNANSCVDWLKFYPVDFTIPGRGSQKVNFVVQVPPDAVGGHYAVLFFETSSGAVWDEAKGVMINVSSRLGSLFYIEPEGTIKRQAQISGFNIKAINGDIELEADFENTGNVDITVKGSFDIIDQEGFVFARGQFKDIYTLPKDKAKLNIRNPAVKLSKGKYDVILTLDLEGAVLVKDYQIEVSDSGGIINIKEVE